MSKRLIFVAIGILTIASLAFVIAEIPTVSFIDPTPTTNQTGNSIYVNLSTTSSLEHYSFVDFDNDLVFWMRMDDYSGNIVYDNSSYGNNGTLVNGSYITTGYYKNATGFDGYNDEIRVSDNSALNSISTTDRITVCVWINQTGIMTGKYAGVVGQYGNEASENGGNNRGYLLAKSSTDYKYEFMISQNGASREGVTSSSTFNLNQWYHICGVYNGTNYLLYVNGALDNSAASTYTSIYDSTSYLGIGNYGYRGVGYENGPVYNGSIDEVLIFNRALSLNEIRAIYNSSAYRFEKNYTSLANGGHTFTGYAINSEGNFSSVSRTIYTGVNGSAGDTTPPNVQFVSPTPSTNVSGNSIYVNLSTSDESEHYSFVDFDNDLVFWMRMDDLNSSGQPLDLSYYGNNGSLNDVVINSSSGYFGNGSYFNDAGFIDVPDSDSLDIVGLSDQITVCSWFKIKQHGTDYTGIVARYNTLSGNPDRQFLIGKNNTDNRYGFFLSYSGTTFNAVVLTNTELSTEIWYHLCGTSNGTVSLYLNGVQQTSTTTITGIKDTVNSSLYIGKFGRANSEFNGNIDEVLIFNRALSLNEIRAIYNSSAYRFEKNYTSLANGGHT
ncbi:MAG: LamG domain-containing protein, partial [Candidatus Pacearchaeota archaeon]